MICRRGVSERVEEVLVDVGLPRRQVTTSRTGSSSSAARA
jgi:hypothetical protein